MFSNKFFNAVKRIRFQKSINTVCYVISVWHNFFNCTVFIDHIILYYFNFDMQIYYFYLNRKNF